MQPEVFETAQLMPGKFKREVIVKRQRKRGLSTMMTSSSALSMACKQQRSQEIDETFDANIRRSTSCDDFARQQFCKNRKVIIRNVARVTYDVRTNESIV